MCLFHCNTFKYHSQLCISNRLKTKVGSYEAIHALMKIRKLSIDLQTVILRDNCYAIYR